MDKRERSEGFELGRGTAIERFSGKSAVGDSTGFKGPREKFGIIRVVCEKNAKAHTWDIHKTNVGGGLLPIAVYQ
ncbi:hypothetical protein [Pseudomonas khavaziana]|uniref:Uncharacterized protein n=1 Tax=Pseudomonas khavaziana TaxID=2842351 RepID=A0ABZ2DQR8_9PSED